MRPRKARAATQRPRVGIGDGAPTLQVLTLKQLEDRTRDQCETEFAATWGEPFHKPGERGLAAFIIERSQADLANKQIEDDARKLYENLRKRLVRVSEEAAEFLKRPPSHPGALDGVTPFSGGVVTQMLGVLSGRRHPTISEIEGVIASRVPGAPDGYRRNDGRMAFVARLISEAGRPPLNFRPNAMDLTNREIAVVSILCSVGPDGWGGYAQRLKNLEPVYPQDVISDEVDRVRRIRAALAAEPSGSPSVSQ